MKFLRILLQVLICAFIFQFPFAWILRDGLGPDSLETFGFVAASKAFMTFYSGPILMGLFVLYYFVKKAEQRQN
tara:strand:- start:127 stop:348 length:222 start_codon:yes stop_codon:yes gene_type:complete